MLMMFFVDISSDLYTFSPSLPIPFKKDHSVGLDCGHGKD